MKSLKLRFFLLFTGLGVLIALGVGLMMYLQYMRYIKNSYGETLAQVTLMAEKECPEVIEADYLRSEWNTDTYWNTIRNMEKICASFNITYIYYLVNDNGRFRFIVSSEYTRDMTEQEIFGMYDDPPEALVTAFQTRTFQLTKSPYTDEYGTFVSGFRPLFNDGQFMGVLCADYDVTFVRGLERQALAGLIIALVAAIAISAALALGVAATLIKPIRYTIGTLKTIAEGDLTRQIETTGNDELGEMTKFLNRTQNGIKSLVIAIEGKADSLSEVGNELSVMVTQSAAAVHQISANTQGMKEKFLTQAAGVTETNATMEQIAIGINHLNTNIEDQAESVSRSSSAIEEMAANIRLVTESLIRNEENIKTLTAASEKGYTALQKVSADIHEVAKESERLLEINKVIQNIASQTNLLSMNAAIEAAHAGVVGKGFAVVADEIRKLAESSAEQAKMVSTVLKKIKDSMDGINGSTATALNHFENIEKGVKTVSEQETHIRNAMEEQDAGSRQILETISKSNDITQRVRLGSDAMRTGSKEVIEEGQNLEILTEDLTHGINEIATAMNQINTVVTRIQEISMENKEDIAVLIDEITKFKVA
jgi:methyl-accepting chemotaxis protein